MNAAKLIRHGIAPRQACETAVNQALTRRRRNTENGQGTLRPPYCNPHIAPPDEICGLTRNLTPRRGVRIDHWLQILQRDHTDLQAHFSGRLDRPLTLLEIEGVDAWMTAILDRYDKRGLGAAIEVIANLDAFAGRLPRPAIRSGPGRTRTIPGEVFNRSGRPAPAGHERKAHIYRHGVDYLPAFLNVFDTRADNETLYKLTAVYHWAQNRYGGWRLDALGTPVAVA